MPNNENVPIQKTKDNGKPDLTAGVLRENSTIQQSRKTGQRGIKALYVADLILLIMIIIFNLLAWNSTAFCDWYVEHIYPVLAVNIWSRFFAVFPFSMGEWLILVAIIILAVGILLAAVCAIRYVVKKFAIVLHRKTTDAEIAADMNTAMAKAAVADAEKVSNVVSTQEAETMTDEIAAAVECPEVSGVGRRSMSLPRLTRALWNFILTVALFTVLLMTINYFILYHTTGFAGEYLKEGDHSEEQLLAVYNMLAEKCNELSEAFERDEDGNILYDGDLEETAKAAMQTLGNTYPQLSGYYPTAKKIYFSNLFSQEYLMGIVFPYTMEANYNRIMYVTNKPFAICHELAHIKGYIREDEANFLSYLACIGSDDELFQYSAYLEMYTYVINDAYKNYDIYSGIWEDAVRVNATVTADNVFLKAETWAEVEENAVVSTETVKEVSNTLNDANLKMNGVESGMVSYSEVVELLLDYYTENEAE